MPRGRKSASNTAAAAAGESARKASAGSSKKTAPSRYSAGKQKFVANSSDVDDDIEGDSTLTPAPTSSKTTRSASRRVFSGVVIPKAMDNKDKKSRLSAAASSTESRSGGSTREGSLGQDTPDTTAANTPADGFGSFALNSGPKFSLGGTALGLSNKRKRSLPSRAARTQPVWDTDEDEQDLNLEDADAALARQLQEEEWAGRQQNAVPSKKRRRVADDDDEDEDVELPSEEEEDEDEPLWKRARNAKFGDPPSSSRRASQKANSKISKAARAVPADFPEEEEESDEEPIWRQRKPAFGDPPSSSRRASQKASTKISKTARASAAEAESAESEFDPDGDEERDDRRGSVSTLTSLDSGTSTPTGQSTLVAIRAANARRQRARANARVNLRGRRRPFDRREARRNKLETAHPEIKTMWDDLKLVPIIKPVEGKQPNTISRRLKPFQLEGLDWMVKQEKSQYKGGLLGDEMGMGKTIQAVSLIMSDFPAKAPSLVLVPPVALMQWANEIKDYTDGKLKVLIVHNTNAKSKNLTKQVINAHNVVIMSYNSLESMYRKQEKGWSRGDNLVKEKSPLHSLTFHRVILDEAHSIKSRTTGVAKACFALKGTYKWCLSGTPVQNRIGEFFSLLRFLEVRPFADYFCEKCDCAQLHWSVGEDYMCTHCKHSAAEHRSVFNEELLNPITGDSMELRSEALDKLHMITARVMLRRLKKDHTSSMELPPKEIVIHNEFFGEIERDFSSSIMTNSARKFNTYVAQGVMLNNYANIFGLIMQMRQVANHPDLITRKSAEGGQNVLVCNICDEPAEEAIKSRCQGGKCHFCRTCVKNFVQTCEASGSEADCPRCHVPLSVDWEQPEIIQDEDEVKKSSIINRINMSNWTSSTKIEMLVYDLYKLRSKKQTLKTIVFSQFTSMLQLVEWRLRRAGFNTVMLDGSMTPVQRQRSIDYFMKNPDVEVFLVSLKAGGVALNLTEASRVFIIDPWWNPAAEWQSADRCHRIGQARPCVITRLVIEDSVESRMVMLQEKKASMISGTINNDKVAMDKLSPEDLQFLFRGT